MLFRSGIHVILTLVAAFLAAKFLPGVITDDVSTIIIIAGALALVNLGLRPVISRMNFVFTALTIGIVVLMVNAAFIKLASVFLDGFTVNGWLTIFLFSLVITGILIIADTLLVRKPF